MNRIPLHAAVYVLCTVLCGCASLGFIKPESFQERLAAAYTLNTTISEAAASSLAAGALSSEDGEKALEQTRAFRTRLDQVKTIAGTDLSGADARLAALESALQVLRSELLAKGVKVNP